MLDRIKTFIGHKKLSVRKFEMALGMSNGTIHNAIVNGSSISSQWLTKMSEVYPELNTYWVLTGKGEMLQNAKSTGKNKIPYFNVDFSGGFVELYNDQTSTPTEYMDCKGIKGVQFWCNIKGHSMEPTIADGERIALQEVALDSSLQFGSIYALVTSDGLRTVKRVERSNEDGMIELVADNKEYKSQEIYQKDITHLFKVIAHLGLL